MHSGYPSINHRLTEPTWQGPDEIAAERRVICVVLNIGEERAIVGVRYGDIRRSTRSGQLCLNPGQSHTQRVLGVRCEDEYTKLIPLDLGGGRSGFYPGRGYEV